MSKPDTAARRLLALLDLDPSDIAADIVETADGHDARIELIRNLLTLTSAISAEVGFDMEAVGDGYETSVSTGETDEGPEGRAEALNYYACWWAAREASTACDNALREFNKRIEAAERIPSALSAEAFVKGFEDIVRRP